MKSISLFFTGALLALMAPAFASEFQFPDYQKTTLENGLTIYLIEKHDVPMINLSMVFDAGAIHDGNQYGLAATTARALKFGAGKWTQTELEQAVDFLGAQLACYGDLESSTIQANFAAADFEKMGELILALVTQPQFDQDDFNRYLQRQKAQLTRQKESPRSVIGSYFNRAVFGKHPYGNPVNGTVTTLSDLSLDAVKTFHSTYYRPETAAIAVVGDFDSKAMMTQLKKMWSEWNPAQMGQTTTDLPDFKPLDGKKVLLVNKSDSIQTMYTIGKYGIAYNDSDFVPISVVNTILGGRFTSWLNTELRIKSGLSYGARSTFSRNKENGTFAASSFTATPTTERALDLTMEVFDRLQKQGIDEETLRSGKNYMKGNFPRRYESPAALCGFLTDMFLYGVDENFINTFEQKLDAVDAQTVKRVIQTYFTEDNLQFVLIGKGSDIKDLAKKYGPVQEIDIKDDSFLNP